MPLTNDKKLDLICLLENIPGAKQLNEQEKIKIADGSDYHEYEDGVTYSAEGCVSQGLSIMDKGLFRITNLKPDGKEKKMRDLNFPGYNIFVGNIDSFYNRTPAPTSILSIGYSSAFGFSYGNLISLRKDISVFDDMMHRMMISSFMAHPNLIRSIEYLKKQEKRIQFNIKHPNIARELTLVQLASLFTLGKNAY